MIYFVHITIPAGDNCDKNSPPFLQVFQVTQHPHDKRLLHGKLNAKPVSGMHYIDIFLFFLFQANTLRLARYKTQIIIYFSNSSS